MISSCSLEKMANPPWNMLLDSLCNVGELTNYENFYNFKLSLLPNSLMGATFTWYTTLPRNSIQSWQEMERQFHTQFFRAKLEVCIA